MGPAGPQYLPYTSFWLSLIMWAQRLSIFLGLTLLSTTTALSIKTHPVLASVRSTILPSQDAMPNTNKHIPSPTESLDLPSPRGWAHARQGHRTTPTSRH